ncbi:MAG: archaeal proteasome endopeptidase complex subunit beta [Candidatus Aenigmatarchaeota archaeon]
MDKEKMQELRKTGTTTVGAVCRGAVVLGADRKATMGYLVATKEAKKILQLDEHIGMTIAGLEGDAQALERYIKAELKLYKLQEGRKIPVGAAATLVSNILYSRRAFPYIVQLVVGGYDTEPRLYSFDPSGSITEEKEYFSTGSGSPVAFGVLEDRFKPGMTVDDAKKLVAKALKSATERDIASGGKGIDLIVIDSKGYREVPEEEVKGLFK